MGKTTDQPKRRRTDHLEARIADLQAGREELQWEVAQLRAMLSNLTSALDKAAEKRQASQHNVFGRDPPKIYACPRCKQEKPFDAKTWRNGATESHRLEYVCGDCVDSI